MNSLRQHVMNMVIREGLPVYDDEVRRIIESVSEWLRLRATEKDLEQPVDAPYYRLISDEVMR